MALTFKVKFIFELATLYIIFVYNKYKLKNNLFN